MRVEAGLSRAGQFDVASFIVTQCKLAAHLPQQVVLELPKGVEVAPHCATEHEGVLHRKERQGMKGWGRPYTLKGHTAIYNS